MIRVERNDARMVRCMCNITPEDKTSAEELRAKLKLKSTRESLQEDCNGLVI